MRQVALMFGMLAATLTAAQAQSPREDFGEEQFPHKYEDRVLGAAPPPTVIFKDNEARAWGGTFGIDVSHHTCGDDASASLKFDVLGKFNVKYVYMKGTNGS